MSNITGSIYSLSRNISRRLITFEYASAPALVGSTIVDSVEDVVTVPDVSGNFAVTLAMGDYIVYVGTKTGARDVYRISIPDDTNSYSFASRIVSAVTQSPTAPAGGATPNASTSVFGLVKTDKNVAQPIVPVGVFYKDNVAAMKTISTHPYATYGPTYCTLIKRAVGEPKYFYFDSARTDADDPVGFTIVRPTDYATAGVWVQDTP